MNVGTAADDYPARVDRFVGVFFGPGNPVWPDRDPNSSMGRRLTPYLQVLRAGDEVPIVLPRKNQQTRQSLAYVIPRDRRHAAAVADLLQAFVGPSHARFNGLPAKLSEDDPIDRAVLDFAGHSSIFVLASPRAFEKRMWDSLRLMQQAVAVRPHRAWHAPIPVGRLLAQFDLALASGANAASGAVLDQLAGTGALSAANLCHLRIKRLARLGRNSELLRLPDLVDVALTQPPTPVRDAILSAVFSTSLAEPLAAGDLRLARTRLIEVGAIVPALMDGSLADLSPQALTVLALASWIVDTVPLTGLFRQEPQFLAAMEGLAPDLVAHFRATDQEKELQRQLPAIAPRVSATTPTSWPQLIKAIAAEQDVGTVLEEEAWRNWTPAAEADRELATALEQFDDEAANRAWPFVGAFVDSDRYLHPAANAAREFLTNALTHGRFSPGDLAGIVALTEITLRASPDASKYAQLLDDLAAEASRWAGPDRATTVLDLADLVARTPCPDAEARLRLAYLLLRPLADHPTRLDADQVAFAARLSAELEVPLSWHQQPPNAAAGLGLAEVPAQELLLYSLDENVLDRVRTELAIQAPQARVTTSHDHVGSRQLKQWVRRADVIVMATRCATHAATGFIRANCRPETIVQEADGSGSASLLRAATIAMTRRPTESPGRR
ncbi:hypothetical protein GA0070558_15123 [Micromonospora haikouensis]|uniref:Uncharacterized protein n=1 Tax=Micromonospora haikouensis TaxID=686309 RepID=A0A1C4YJW6_9ACTN|nr:protein DpdD [Micromonospora haikouensis]SCF21019.1 hypothetical protein GA0070558_15123 [Micromonospora haikouensis]